MRIILAYLVLSCLMSFRAQAQEVEVDSAVHVEVNFDLDSYRLGARERHRLDSLFEEVPFSIIRRIEVYGHTDSLASPDYNLTLSKRRVQGVLTYLMRQGYDPIKIITDHYGEFRPRYDNSPEIRYKNRRVEMVLYIDAALIPDPERKLVDNTFEEGEKVRLPDLNFVGNQPVPVAESFEVLGELLEVMQSYPDLKVELQGHVCCSDDQRLSEERARMVYFFLRSNGIAKERLSYKGFSNSQPLFKEVDARSRALNRRVEVLVLSNSGRRVTPPEDQMRIELEAPVLNVRFADDVARLIPSGDFMLTLLAEMMRESEGLYYEFVMYDNIDNERLTRQRAAVLGRTLRQKRVPRGIYSVEHQESPDWMTTMPNENSVVVKITQR